MIRRPPRSTLDRSSAASDVYKRQELNKLKEEAPKLKDFEGKLGNKEDLKAFLLLNEKLSRKLGKLYVYAHMRLSLIHISEPTRPY